MLGRPPKCLLNPQHEPPDAEPLLPLDYRNEIYAAKEWEVD